MNNYIISKPPNPNPKCIVQQVMPHNVIIVTTMGSGRSKSERSDPIVLINWQMKTVERGGSKIYVAAGAYTAGFFTAVRVTNRCNYFTKAETMHHIEACQPQTELAFWHSWSN